MIFIRGDDLILEYGKHTLDEFRFENGEILENVTVDYMLKGTPKYDESGNIVNAVVFCHNYDRDASSLGDYYLLTSDGGPFDFNDYFFISVTSLGVPDSCSPSSTGLKYSFPQYTFLDKINFKKQFLKEKLNIEKFLGVTGGGMGGYEVFTWACEYPDDMDFIIIGSSAYKTNGYRYVISKAVESVIDASDNFYSDVYDESLSKTMVSINKILYANYLSKRIFQDMSNDEIDVLMDEYVDDGLFIDIYDFKSQNMAILNYDLEDKLNRIKAKTLIVAKNDDVYHSPEYDIMPLKNLIKDCEIILLKADETQLYGADLTVLMDDLNSFLENFKK